ncbi:MAG TPA: hypothetical protein PLB62_16825, partial [Candidatus Sumerlaeota bacterium]|nr:hypothetical protein [Candidatus Sumerlaeota bacterium]
MLKRFNLSFAVLFLMALSLAVSHAGAQDIGWCNTQWPISAELLPGESMDVYGQVYIAGVTDPAGKANGIAAQAGLGPENSNPASDPGWLWVKAEYNTDSGNNDEYTTHLIAPVLPGKYDYCFRFRYHGGNWVYGDTDGSDNGYSVDKAGKLLVKDIVTSPTPTVTPTPTPTPTATPAEPTVDWCNLQWPLQAEVDPGQKVTAYGQV